MNEITNTKDPRFRSIHVPGSDTWALRIQDTVPEDTGLYECQVTTANKTIEMITLNVLGESHLFSVILFLLPPPRIVGEM